MLNNQTGIYHFRCWRGGDRKVIGETLSIFEYHAYINSGWHIIGFPGVRGHVITLIEDMTITRLDCLQYAIAFMEGKLIEYSVDLKTLTATARRIEPPP